MGQWYPRHQRANILPATSVEFANNSRLVTFCDAHTHHTVANRRRNDRACIELIVNDCELLNCVAANLLIGHCCTSCWRPDPEPAFSSFHVHGFTILLIIVTRPETHTYINTDIHTTSCAIDSSILKIYSNTCNYSVNRHKLWINITATISSIIEGRWAE